MNEQGAMIYEENKHKKKIKIVENLSIQGMKIKFEDR